MPVLESPVPVVTTATSNEYIVSPASRANLDAKVDPKQMLSVSPIPEDYEVLSDILESPSWQLFRASSCREAVARLDTTRISAIVCEHSLPDGTWRDVLDYLVNASLELPIIVTARLADEHLWAEVLNLGGFDVLAKPFREREVLYTITSALLYGADSGHRAAVCGV